MAKSAAMSRCMGYISTVKKGKRKNPLKNLQNQRKND